MKPESRRIKRFRRVAFHPEVREAKKEDCPAIALHVYLAGKSHLDISASDVFLPGEPGPTPERLGMLENLLQTRTVSWFHYTHYIAVDVDDRIAASMCVFSNRDRSLESMDKAVVELGWDEQAIKELKQRMAPYEAVDFDVPGEALQIETVCVSPDFRRRGLATEMLEEVISLGRQQNFGEVFLAIYLGNTPAQRAYEKVGFKIVREKRNPVFERLTECPGKALMRLDLKGQ